MFNVGATEILLLLLIALVVVGPKDLPRVARALGRFVRYVREMVEEIKRETGLDEVAEELKDVSRDLEHDLKQADIRKDLRQAEHEINKELRSAQKAVDFKSYKNDIKNGHP